MCLKPEIIGLPINVNHGAGLFRYVPLRGTSIAFLPKRSPNLTLLLKLARLTKTAHVLN